MCCRPYPREPNGSLSRGALKSLLGVCVVCVRVGGGSSGGGGGGGGGVTVVLYIVGLHYCHLWGWVMWVNRTDQLEFILL